ncbi:hypothetical protein Dsin_000460 [Dipteronia sinensis]|uniref:Uncharacterized protein n=1 Tax=Dipteronia sinensis TaxID=43782 RepID=A0AAE0EHT2_9ROSI|nr:hypothetical protein Dsin_000460 [Dipteronia sinensis]
MQMFSFSYLYIIIFALILDCDDVFAFGFLSSQKFCSVEALTLTFCFACKRLLVLSSYSHFLLLFISFIESMQVRDLELSFAEVDLPVLLRFSFLKIENRF